MKRQHGAARGDRAAGRALPQRVRAANGLARAAARLPRIRARSASAPAVAGGSSGTRGGVGDEAEILGPQRPGATAPASLSVPRTVTGARGEEARGRRVEVRAIERNLRRRARTPASRRPPSVSVARVGGEPRVADDLRRGDPHQRREVERRRARRRAPRPDVVGRVRRRGRTGDRTSGQRHARSSRARNTTAPGGSSRSRGSGRRRAGSSRPGRVRSDVRGRQRADAPAACRAVRGGGPAASGRGHRRGADRAAAGRGRRGARSRAAAARPQRTVTRGAPAVISPITAARAKPSAAEDREHVVDRVGRAGDEQSARGLRIGQQHALASRRPAPSRHVLAVARPVAPRGAGERCRRARTRHAGSSGTRAKSIDRAGVRRRGRSRAGGRAARSR